MDKEDMKKRILEDYQKLSDSLEETGSTFKCHGLRLKNGRLEGTYTEATVCTDIYDTEPLHWCTNGN